MRFFRLHFAFSIEFPTELSNKTFQQHSRHFHGHQYWQFRPFSAICDRYASSFGFGLALNSWKSSWKNRELGKSGVGKFPLNLEKNRESFREVGDLSLNLDFRTSHFF